MPDAVAAEFAARLDRIEALLAEGNALRREAMQLQRESLEVQKSLVSETRANLAKAGTVNDQALLIQNRAKRLQLFILPVLAVLIGYASWLLFFRAGGL